MAGYGAHRMKNILPLAAMGLLLLLPACHDCSAPAPPVVTAPPPPPPPIPPPAPQHQNMN